MLCRSGSCVQLAARRLCSSFTAHVLPSAAFHIPSIACRHAWLQMIILKVVQVQSRGSRIRCLALTHCCEAQEHVHACTLSSVHYVVVMTKVAAECRSLANNGSKQQQLHACELLFPLLACLQSFDKATSPDGWVWGTTVMNRSR